MPGLSEAFLGVHYAHRGLHDVETGAAENSLESIRRAVAEGYGVELDLRVAACGEAMVFHDEALERMTGRSGRVGDFDADALASLELVGGGAIPRLEAALALVDGQAPLLLEMKIGGGAGEAEKLVRRVAELVGAYVGPVAVKSYDAGSLRHLARRQPQVPRGIVVRGPVDETAAAALFEGVDFVSWHAEDLPCVEAARLRERGIPVFAWTVRDAAEQKRLSVHSDGLIFEQFRPGR